MKPLPGPDTQTPRRIVLDGNTPIPLGQVFVLVSVIAGWIALYYRVDYRLDGLEGVVSSLEEAVQTRWSRDDMAGFADLLQAKNPDLEVPEVRR